MYFTIILTYRPIEAAFMFVNDEKVIGIKWLYNLAKELRSCDTDNHIKFIGQDEKKRVEVDVSIMLFEALKTNPLFIQKTENLRRVRSKTNGSSMHVLEAICFPISDFDNDFDDKETIKRYNDLTTAVKQQISL